MKKLLIFFLIPLIFSCSRNFDHSNVYRIIQEKFPHDSFIKKSIDKAKEPAPEVSTSFPIENEYLKLNSEDLDIIIEESLKNINYLFEIELSNK